MSSKCDLHPKPDPARQLPDDSVCRAKTLGNSGVMCCLVDQPQSCEHVCLFDNGIYCFHPNRAEIAARTIRQNEVGFDGGVRPVQSENPAAVNYLTR